MDCFRKLSLSTNMIEKITGLNGMKNLRILSLGRNYIKSFNGLVSYSDIPCIFIQRMHCTNNSLSIPLTISQERVTPPQESWTLHLFTLFWEELCPWSFSGPSKFHILMTLCCSSDIKKKLLNGSEKYLSLFRIIHSRQLAFDRLFPTKFLTCSPLSRNSVNAVHTVVCAQ